MLARLAGLRVVSWRVSLSSFFPGPPGTSIPRSGKLIHLSPISRSDETGCIASKEPFCVSLKAGKKYAWCKCGLSKKQPFCDGNHKQGSLTPLRFTCEEDIEEAFLCGCKQTSTPPYCDGTHATPHVQDNS